MIPGLLSSPVGLLARLDDIPPCGNNGPFPPPPPLGGGLLGPGQLGNVIGGLLGGGCPSPFPPPLGGGLLGPGQLGNLLGELLGNPPVHASMGTQVGSEG